MLLNAQLFINKLSEKGLKFDYKTDSDGDVIVKFPYDGKTTTFIFTSDDGKIVSIYTVYESIPDDKVPDMILFSNSLNAKYKWLKFYVDKDNDLMVQSDAILTPETAAETCYELLLRRINILDDEKRAIMLEIYK